MDFNEIIKLVSPGTVLIVYAIAEVGNYYVARTPEGKLPRWFIFIPVISGLAVGMIHYAGFTPTEAIKAQTWGKTVALSLFEGFLTAAVAVLVFEFRKRIKKQFFPKDNKPEDPKPTP